MKMTFSKMNNNRINKSMNAARKNQGFTLVELIVTITIMVIVMGLTVFGIFSWINWSQFKQENEYAQTLFIAAQNQLTEYASNGRLDLMNESLEKSALYGDDKYNDEYILDLTDATDENGDVYNPDMIWPESVSKAKPELYREDIIHLQADADNGDYDTYLNQPATLKTSNPSAYWVYELLNGYVYDTAILEKGAISIEIAPQSGQVFAVLYSDQSKTYRYAGVLDANTNADSPNASYREEAYRRNFMVGFFDVNSLTVATKSPKLKIKNLKLNNQDTLNLTFDLGDNSALTQTLKYQITLFDDDKNSPTYGQKLMSFVLDGAADSTTGNPGLSNKNTSETRLSDATATQKTVDIYRYSYLSDGKTEDKTEELKSIPVLCWYEDKTVTIVLDAADIQATSTLYEKELDAIRDYTSTTPSKFQKSLSYFRFGFDADEVYCKVVAKSDSITSKEGRSNSENPVFGKKSKVTLAGTLLSAEYKIDNARHLYNIRYISDLAYDKQLGTKASKSYSVDSVEYTLTDDIDWSKFQKEGNLYNTVCTTANISKGELQKCEAKGELVTPDDISTEDDTDPRFVCDFPSIKTLRSKDSFSGKDSLVSKQKTISGLRMSQKSNAIYQEYVSDKTDSDGNPVSLSMKPTALFNISYGSIKECNLDQIIVAGNQIAGGFAGINVGSIEKLSVLNTEKDKKDTSIIAGNYNVGGIAGYNIAMKGATKVDGYDVVIKDLNNYARIEGHQSVGGIFGMIRNDYNMTGKDVSINLSELTGLSPEIRNQLANPSTILSIALKDSNNYGAIVGISKDEMKNSSGTAGTKPGEDRTNAEVFENDPKYLGGIVGYSFNASANDPNLLVLENCNSTPNYRNNPIEKLAEKNNKSPMTAEALKAELSKELKGVYVGGIVGYNYRGFIKECNATPQKDQDGYVFGYEYVGGIVGMNIGPAAGIEGGNSSKHGVNANHVIGYKYVGGITGSNANIASTTKDGKTIKQTDYDPEKATLVLEVDSTKNLKVALNNWENRGVVMALKEYAGGITGYNTGFLYSCSSLVEKEDVEDIFGQIYSGDYIGGIAGYNNGILGNSKRSVDAKDSSKSTVTSKGSTINVTTYVTGTDFVGGIVGYNDVDAIVENYEVNGGWVLGSDNSYFVGGYAGLNASLDLLVETETTEKTSRVIASNPYEVKGAYFVGGTIGGNIVSTGKSTNNIKNYDDAANTITQGSVYAEYKKNYKIEEVKDGSNNVIGYRVSGDIHIVNNTGNPISCWTIDLGTKNFTQYVINHPGIKYVSDTNRLKWAQQYSCVVPTGNKNNTSYGVNFTFEKQEDAVAFAEKKFDVYYFGCETNIVDNYIGSSDSNAMFDVSIKKNNGWEGVAQLDLQLKNLTNETLPNYRIEFSLPEGCSVNNIWSGLGSKYEVSSDGKVAIYTDASKDNYNPLIGPNETISFGLQLKYPQTGTTDAEKKAIEDQYVAMFTSLSTKIYLNNVEYHGSATGTTPSDPSSTDDVIKNSIQANFSTNSFSGTLNADAFVGGFVGYNLLLSGESGNVKAADVIKALLEKYEEVDKDETLVAGVATDDEKEAIRLAKKVLLLDDLDTTVGKEVKVSKDTRFIISGANSEKTQNKLGGITGKIFVGGVIGYNDKRTYMTIQNVINYTPVTATLAIRNDEEQKDIYTGVIRKDYAGKDFTYSYAGGITGRVNNNTLISNCKNASGATVTSVGSYTGGITEVNTGCIEECVVSSLGSVTKDYVGGIVGLNKGKETDDGVAGIVKKCVIENQTITGRNYVGGFVAENFGTLYGGTVKNAKINANAINVNVVNKDGDTVVEKQGVAGLFAAYNMGSLRIGDDKNLETVDGVDLFVVEVDISSNGKYVGGIVGRNDGALVHDIPGTAYLTVRGTIVGNECVGGFIGENRGVTVSAENATECILSSCRNEASVSAMEGGAGGIVGSNLNVGTTASVGDSTAQIKSVIKNCVNFGTVSATKSGDAGGITAINSGTILECINHGSVLAPNGMSGGICAINEKDGIIEKCYVDPDKTKDIAAAFQIEALLEGDANTLDFASRDVVGGICADNFGTIKNIKLKSVNVYNYTSSSQSDIGIICGRNEATGKILLGVSSDAINSCSAMTYTNYSNVGGICGKNLGKIQGADLETKTVNGVSVQVPKTIFTKIKIGFKSGYASIANFGGIAGVNQGEISNISVKETEITGNLSSETTGYGGLVGFNGFTAEDIKKDNLNAKDIYEQKAYNATITNCSFDGTVHGQGSGVSIARVGGIVGTNGYKGGIIACHIGIHSSSIADDAENTTKITAGHVEYIDKTETIYKRIVTVADPNSYSYTGGITGENYGLVSECNNKAYSIDTVIIESFTGNNGGIVGISRRYSVIEGKETAHTSTGTNWSVKMRGCDNDSGCGGICGRYESCSNVTYLDNYASVNNAVVGNGNTAGIIGFFYQQDATSTTTSFCNNYGEVTGSSRMGGIISQFKGKGGTISDCTNYGSLRATGKTEHFVGGIIGRIASVNTDSFIIRCKNHGNIYALACGNKREGGICAGSYGLEDSSRLTIDDCVNTGLIRIVDSKTNVLSTSTDSGGIYGNYGEAYITNCRNYGTGDISGIAKNFKYMANCFTYNGDNKTEMYPFTATKASDAEKKMVNNYCLIESGSVGISSVPLKYSRINLYAEKTWDLIGAFTGYYFHIDGYSLFNIPTKMSQNPYQSSYYPELTVSEENPSPAGSYLPAYDEGTTPAKNTRASIIIELDEKMVSLINEFNVDKINASLPNPTNQKLASANGTYKFSWNYDEANNYVYGYEYYYDLVSLTDENHKITHINDTKTAVPVTKYANFDVEELEKEWKEKYGNEAYRIEAYVRAMSRYHMANEGKNNASKYDSEYVMATINGMKKLPLPEYHLELIEGNYYVAVLDNFDEYEDCKEAINYIRISGYGKAFYFKSDESTKKDYVDIDLNTGVSAPFRINRDKTTNADDESRMCQAVAKANNGYTSSTKTITYGIQYDNKFIDSEDDNNITTKFDGFYGKNPNSMSYHMVWKAQYRDVYLAGDLVAKDDNLGVDVAYAHGISHVSCRVERNAVVTFDNTLSGIPNSIFGKKVTLRSYLFETQQNDTAFGHYVNQKTSLNSISDIRKIKDQNYINSDGLKETDESKQGILDENDQLKPGYVIYDNGDGTYDVYYNATLAMDEKDEAKVLAGEKTDRQNYQVKKALYNFEETAIDQYDIYKVSAIESNADRNAVKDLGNKNLQPKPEVDSTFTETEGDYPTYKFTWDSSHDSSEVMYQNAEYSIELIGVALDGSRVSLSTITSTTDKEFEVTANASWNYKEVILQVTRLGTTVDGTDSSQSSILPRYADEARYKIRLQLDQLAAPNVSLMTKDNSPAMDTSEYKYDVTWDDITDAYEVADLGGYLIVVEAQETEGISEKTKTHYYYVKVNSDADDVTSVKKLKEKVPTTNEPVVEVGTSEVLSQGLRKTTIDLSDFKAKEELKISVKAVAKKDAETYKDGPVGVATYLVLPVRMGVLDVSKLSANVAYDASSYIDADSLNEGVVLSYSDSAITTSSRADVAILIMDNATKNSLAGDGISGDEDTGKVTKHGDFKNKTDSDYWNSGASNTIYPKANSGRMLGNLKDGETATININVSEGKLSDYAGQWLKIALKNSANNAISSPWSDEDQSGLTKNYKWIRIPRVLLATNNVQMLEDTTQYYIASSDSFGDSGDIETKHKSFRFETSEYADTYHVQLLGTPYIDHGVETRNIGNLYIEKNVAEDGYNIFYNGTGLAVNGRSTTAEDGNVCTQNTGAIYLGKTADGKVYIPDYSFASDLNGNITNTNVYGSVTMNNHTFQVSLPDLTAVNGVSCSEGGTETVLVQSLVYAIHEECYEKSAIQKLDIATGVVDDASAADFEALSLEEEDSFLSVQSDYGDVGVISSFDIDEDDLDYVINLSTKEMMIAKVSIWEESIINVNGVNTVIKNPVFTGFGTVGTMMKDGNLCGVLRLNGDTYAPYFSNENYVVSVNYITISDLLNGKDYSESKAFVDSSILKKYTELRDEKVTEKASQVQDAQEKTVSENSIE